MLRSLFLLAALWLTGQAQAFFPLPYPLDAPDIDLLSTDGPTRDPLAVKGYFELYQGGKLREMELPHFHSETKSLGYQGPDTFTVTPALRPRVDFWKRIFTEFTSHQMVFHDPDDLSVIYETVDVGHITKDESLSPKARRRALARHLKPIRRQIAENLRFLDEAQKDPLKIPLELFPLFQKFQNNPAPDRFVQAALRVRAQQGQKDRLVRGFFFGGRYLPTMMDIFEKKGLPKELTRLPMVESGFDLGARSKVGASGIWQFMQSTGKLYLRIDNAVDERNDPISATWAAAELLSSNYQKLGNWGLAITAYNHGPEGMARAVGEVGSDRIEAIIQKYKAPTFGFASSNFYAEFLAILEIEREYRQHFGALMVDSPVPLAELPVVDNVSLPELALACDLDAGELAVLNPALTDWVTSGEGFVPTGYLLKVPPEKEERCKSGYQNITKIESGTIRFLSSAPE